MSSDSNIVLSAADERRVESDDRPVHWIGLALLAAIVGLVPLIVCLRAVRFEGIAAEVYGPAVQGNFFSYYKAVWLVILSTTALLWFTFNRRAQRPCWYYQPLGLYAFFSVISTVFAEHWQLALFGDPHRHEGLLVHLSYMAIVFLFINMAARQRELKILGTCLLASAAVLAIAGAAQFFGYEYMYAGWAKWLLVPQRMFEVVSSIDLTEVKNQGHLIFLTFGNGNFTGSYMAMLFALTLAMAVLAPKKWKYFLVPLNVLLFVNLLGAKSRAGMLAGMVAALALLPFMRSRLRCNWRVIAFLLCSYLIAPFIMDAYTWKRGDVPRFLGSVSSRPLENQPGLFGNFEDLQLASQSATFVFDGFKSEVRLNNDRLEFYDQHGELVPYRLLPNPKLRTGGTDIMASYTAVVTAPAIVCSDMPQTGVASDGSVASSTAFASKEYLVVFPEKRMRGFMIYAWPEFNVLEIGRGGVSFYLLAAADGFKLLNQYGKPAENREVEVWGFKNRQHFASNRGYIWSRTLPLLKRTLLIGFGPDTFAAHFPNHDCMGKLKTWPGGGLFTMIEKPHSQYLQIAINSGLISLFAMLVMFAVFLYESASIYWSCKFNGFAEIMGVGLSAAVLAYLIAAIFNDSVVSVAPVFWSLLGMGIAANRINRQSRKTIEEC